MTRIIIDTDPGVDDAMAIFYAALCPEVEVVALTTVFGNVHVGQATRNALHLAEMAGLDVPVAEGAHQPSVLPPFTPSAHVHGPEGFGALPAVSPRGQPVREDAADLMARLCRDAPGQITVCAIGPITNVAEAIRRHPDFTRNVARIVLMGGAVHVPGNITRHAEANTYHDPHALQVVLDSGAEVVVVGLDVTMQVLCTREDFAALAAASPDLGGFLRDAGAFYLDFYRDVVGLVGCGLHDPAAVIACHRPDLFTIVDTPLTVLTEGPEVGRSKPGAGPLARVCTGGDMAAVKAVFLAAFGVV